MKLVKKRYKKRKFILKIALLVLLTYTVVTFINQQIQISKKRAEYEKTLEEIAVQKVKNDELRGVADSADINDKNYVEGVARDLGFAKDGERVFAVISGN